MKQSKVSHSMTKITHKERMNLQILLSLKSKLTYHGYERLDLEHLQALRDEVQKKIDDHIERDRRERDGM